MEDLEPGLLFKGRSSLVSNSECYSSSLEPVLLNYKKKIKQMFNKFKVSLLFKFIFFHLLSKVNIYSYEDNKQQGSSNLNHSPVFISIHNYTSNRILCKYNLDRTKKEISLKHSKKQIATKNIQKLPFIK